MLNNNATMLCIWCGVEFSGGRRCERLRKMIAHEQECPMSPLVKNNAELRRVNVELSGLLTKRVPMIADFIHPRRHPTGAPHMFEFARLVRETATEQDCMAYAAYEHPENCALCKRPGVMPRRLSGRHCVYIALLCDSCLPKCDDEFAVIKRLEEAAEQGKTESVFVWSDRGRMKMIENGLVLSILR